MKTINAITAVVQAEPRLPITLWQLLSSLADGAEDSGSYAAIVGEADLTRVPADFDREMVAHLDAPRMVEFAERRLMDGTDISGENLDALVSRLVGLRDSDRCQQFHAVYRQVIAGADRVFGNFGPFRGNKPGTVAELRSLLRDAEEVEADLLAAR
jgi:hypothetical protein